MWAGMSLISASAFLLVLRHFCYVGRHVLIGATTLLLVLQHFYYMGRHILIGASALLLVLRHFCYVGRHVLISVLALLLCATELQYCTVPSGTYCVVSYSFLITGLGIPIGIDSCHGGVIRNQQYLFPIFLLLP